MEKEKRNVMSGEQSAMDQAEDNIPLADQPQEMIPDEVPRKDGPGGESGE